MSWDDLDRVPWERLEHNYGDASDVPGMLRRGAVGDLDDNLFHQGGWICSAATAALPFLLDLAGGRAPRHRPELVSLIGDFVREAALVEPRFVDEGWPAAQELHFPRMLALLADADPEVRRAALHLVSADRLPYEAVAAALWQRRAAETDRVTRWDLTLAFGELLRHAPESPGVRDHLRSLMDDPADPQLALAAVLALGPDFVVDRVPQAVAALRDSDATAWDHSAWYGGGFGTRPITNAFGQALRHDPAAGRAFALALASSGRGRDERIAGLKQAAVLLATWRTVPPALARLLIDRLGDDDSQVRFQAAYLLGCVPDPAAADRLAELAGDDEASDAAVWALVRLRDPRCVPHLLHRLTGPRLGFTRTGAYMSGPGEWAGYWMPSVEEALAPLHEHAAALAPAVMTQLARPGLLQGICRLLGRWGSHSAAAVPLLIPLLTHPQAASAAAQALGDIGPAAAGAVPDLLRRPELPTAAWAHWRITGDPRVALAALAHTTGNHELRLLGDLGPHAAPAAGHLQDLSNNSDDWVRLEAAFAHHRATGDTGTATRVLTDVVQPLAAGTCRPAMITALEYLARIGQPVPIARAVLDSPRRLAYFGSWRTFIEDERLRAAATTLAGVSRP
ncbi:HEAT repeat domain-containing protein [Actinoplanes sp. CA-054009]